MQRKITDAAFWTKLCVEKNLDGRWVLTEDLIYVSLLRESPVIVPLGFVTDFASVPRLPLAFWLMGDTAHAAAVVHDYLYRTGDESQKVADDIFFEAMTAEGVAAWRRWPMYAALRLFGHLTYDRYRNNG